MVDCQYVTAVKVYCIFFLEKEKRSVMVDCQYVTAVNVCVFFFLDKYSNHRIQIILSPNCQRGCSVKCLSAIFMLVPGLILFPIMWSESE